MLKAIVMGQLAAENLDDTRQRYKSLGNQVWINMKERERSLNLVRSQVEDLWAYAQSLVRVEVFIDHFLIHKHTKLVVSTELAMRARDSLAT